MKVEKGDLISIYAQSIGIEAARELINKKINAAALKGKETYTEEEIVRICNELVKEGGLAGIVAQTFLIQLERRKSEVQRSLLDNIGTHICCLADMETCGVVNKACADFFGVERKDMEYGSLYDTLSREQADVCIAGNREVFEKKRQIRIEEWIKNGRGEKRLLSITKTPKLGDNGDVEYVVCAAEDITERKLAEARIKHLNSVLRAIKNVNQLIATEKDRDSLIRKSCNALVDARGYDAVWLGLLEAGETFATIVGSGFRKDISRFSEYVLAGNHTPCIKNALAHGDTVLVVEKSRECGNCFFKDSRLGRKAMIIRIEQAGRLFGLLTVSFAPDVAVDDEEKELLVEMSSDIAIGLHDIEMEGILRKRDEFVRRQNEMLTELAKCRELYRGELFESLKIITESSARVFEVERASVWLYGDDRSMIRCIDMYELSADRHSEGTVLKEADYPSYFKALEEEAFIAVPDAHRDPRTREFSDSYLSPLGITSMLDAPIRLKEEMIGIICYEHVGPVRRWTPEEEIFARSPADCISLAMEAEERMKAEDALRQATHALQEHVEMLKESKKKIEEAYSLREHFLRETSHGIITPATIVGGYSKLLLESGNLDDDQKEKVRIMYKRTEEIQKLVRDAIDGKYLEDAEYRGKG